MRIIREEPGIALPPINHPRARWVGFTGSEGSRRGTYEVDLDDIILGPHHHGVKEVSAKGYARKPSDSVEGKWEVELGEVNPRVLQDLNPTDPMQVYGITLMLDENFVEVNIHTAEGEEVQVGRFGLVQAIPGSPYILGFVQMATMRRKVELHREKGSVEWLSDQARKWEDTYGAEDGVAANFRAAVDCIKKLRNRVDAVEHPKLFAYPAASGVIRGVDSYYWDNNGRPHVSGCRLPREHEGECEILGHILDRSMRKVVEDAGWAEPGLPHIRSDAEEAMDRIEQTHDEANSNLEWQGDPEQAQRATVEGIAAAEAMDNLKGGLARLDPQYRARQDGMAAHWSQCALDKDHAGSCENDKGASWKAPWRPTSTPIVGSRPEGFCTNCGRLVGGHHELGCASA